MSGPQSLVQKSAGTHFKIQCATRESAPGSTGDLATAEARYFDVVLLPWSKEALSFTDLAQTVVFGAAALRQAGNSVGPGGIDTRMLDSLAKQASGGAMSTSQMMDPLHPIGRIGTVKEVAESIVWLASSRAGFVTGANIPIDGGYVAQ